MITLLTLTPLVGALLLVGLPAARTAAARRLGLGVTLLTLLQAGLILARYDTGAVGLQFVEKVSWIPSLNVDYFVGLDGMGLLMVLLTTLLVPFALMASWRIDRDVRIFVALVLFLETGLLGAFTALNFFHWFIFWEISLVPAYFLIKLWGGSERVAAATQFFVYTMVGSIAMLLGFMALFLATGTFDFMALGELGSAGELAPRLLARLGATSLSGESLALGVFLLVFLGFAVKVPMVPFHTWLPSTYAEAPTGVSMLLTGVMSKMGVYGLVRIVLPIFPEQIRTLQTPLLWLAVATIVLAAFSAFAQRDLKRMIAYSSVNHLGYCLLGVFAVVTVSETIPDSALERSAVLNGVLLQMFNHGISAAALFWFVGLIEERTAGRRGVNDFGGLRKVAPVFCGLMGISLFASLGLPGLNGFIGEFLIFKGAFPLAGWATALSVVGLLVTAVFLLTVLQRVFNGPLKEEWNGFADLTLRERWLVMPAIGLMFVLGVHPQLFLQFVNPTVVQLVGQIP